MYVGLFGGPLMPVAKSACTMRSNFIDLCRANARCDRPRQHERLSAT